MFRSPQQLAALNRFLVADELKDHILQCFATGFISHFEYPPPDPWGSVSNYNPVRDAQGAQVLREKMKKEVCEGRMLGGPG